MGRRGRTPARGMCSEALGWAERRNLLLLLVAVVVVVVLVLAVGVKVRCGKGDAESCIAMGASVVPAVKKKTNESGRSLDNTAILSVAL
jgi:hypothetical protein